MADEQHHAQVVAWQSEQVKFAAAEMKRLLFERLYTDGPAKTFGVAHGSFAGVLQFLDDINGTAFVAETLKLISENLDYFLKLAAAMPESEVRQ